MVQKQDLMVGETLSRDGLVMQLWENPENLGMLLEQDEARQQNA